MQISKNNHDEKKIKETNTEKKFVISPFVYFNQLFCINYKIPSFSLLHT